MTKYEKALQLRKIQESTYPANHIEWDKLDTLISILLSAVLKRTVSAKAKRHEFTCWTFTFPESSLTNQDMEHLCEFFHLENKPLAVEPITELSQAISERFVNALLPCESLLSIAEESGVWFIGSEPIEEE